MREEYDDDRTVRKHFKIRRNASSIMIKENNAEIFTEEQLKESCNIVLLRLKKRN